jgi:hypothetical protein
MTVVIKTRRDTAANWSSVNPILALGELGIEIDTKKLKSGDGTTAWNSLSYNNGGSGGGISNIIEDTTPQLGGNLDLNTSNITGVGNINIIGDITISQNIIASGFETPSGTSAQFLKADGSIDVNTYMTTGIISDTGVAGGGSIITNIVTISVADYSGLGSYNPTTIYFVTGT